MLRIPRSSLLVRSGSQVFDDLFQGMDEVLSRIQGDTSSFEIDARDEGGNIVIRADLPGVSKDDVNVTLEKGVLTISAKRESHNVETDGNVYLQERSAGSFTRSLRVPSDISEDIHATLKDGVLQLILKRTEGTKPRKIEIS